jgi:lysyl-tRNA synthetase class 2
MASIEEIRQVRVAKLETLRAQGVDPYPARTLRTHEIGIAADRFEALSGSAEEVVLAGRAMAIRGQGALAFVDLDDGTGKIQAFMRRDDAPAYEGRSDIDGFALFGETADQGDFLEFRGTLALSKRGEKTIFVKSWRMLSKSLRALPDGWYGLKDPDEVLRRRYLDILLNPETRATVERRSRFWNAARSWLLGRGFVEVETPVLENSTGGAEARPFETYHNALDLPVYLRISAGELWQKRLLVAGLPKVFEIGRIFRNEGMSHEHLQDYTQLEYYEAYSDFRQGLEAVRELYLTLATETFGTTRFVLNGHEVDLADPWREVDFCAAIRDRHGVDVLETSEADLSAALERAGVAAEEPFSRERVADQLWKVCRREIGGPAVLTGVPVLMEPLAKRDENDPRVVERFQVILGGSEVGKGFSELNDPIDQRERFERQQAMRDAGDVEAQMGDWDYIEAMEHGMPPAFGFGVSERFFAFLAGKSVREAQIFPLMRPRQKEE